jgi:hypothetical protein
LTAAVLVLGLLAIAASSAQAQQQPRIWAEASVDSSSPYVEQTIVYTVRVFSVAPLERIKITPPQTPGVVVDELDGPLTSYQARGGTRYVVNQYRYAVTPIAPGATEIAATRMLVTPKAGPQWGQSQTPYNPWSLQPRNDPQQVEVSTGTIALDVRAPAAQVQPWLPLEALRLETHWGSHSGVRRGEPLALTIVMTARGTKGSNLPSLTPLLISSDFKAYPEPPETEWQISPDGQSLIGRRVETYTVVPTRDGELRMPSVSIPWWNVRFDRRSVTALPTGGLEQAIRVAGQSPQVVGDESPSAGIMSRHTLQFFFLPIGAALLIAFLFGWWIGAGNTERRSLLGTLRAGAARLGGATGALAGRVSRRGKTLVPDAARQRLDDLGQRLDPGATLEPAVGAVLKRMPLRAKVWWCTRCVGKEREPARMCEFVRKFACAHLKMPMNAPLKDIGEGIARQRPGPEANALRKLLADLDGAVYGNLRLDIAHWKRSFRRGLRRAFARRGPEASDYIERGLPKLNP